MEETNRGQVLVSRLRRLAGRSSRSHSNTDQSRPSSAAIAKQRLATEHLYMGIDVQMRRPCAWSLINQEGRLVTSGWWQADEAPGELRRQLQLLANRGFKLQVGIDAPRQPLPAPREWYWRGGQWEKRKASDRGLGRHCEVVIKSLNIANPQWTPLKDTVPPWMALGFDLFSVAQEHAVTHEVFPSAAYRLLEGKSEPMITLNFSAFGKYPKDMLDACMAAMITREYAQGRGGATPSGDGLGEIILPVPLPASDSGVLDWPQPA